MSDPYNPNIVRRAYAEVMTALIMAPLYVAGIVSTLIDNYNKRRERNDFTIRENPLEKKLRGIRK